MATSVNNIKFPRAQTRKLSHGDEIDIADVDRKKFLFLRKHPFTKCAIIDVSNNKEISVNNNNNVDNNFHDLPAITTDNDVHVYDNKYKDLKVNMSK